MARRLVRAFEQERVDGPHLKRVEADVAGRDQDVEPVAREVMRLQRSTGNEAVSAMLVQRDDTAPVEADTSKKTSGVGTLVLDGIAEAIPVRALSLGKEDLEITAELGPWTRDLMKLETSNAAIEHATLTTSSGFTLTMKNLHVSSLRMSSPRGPRQGSRQDAEDIDLVAVRFVFETSTRKQKEKKPEANDDWTAHYRGGSDAT